MLDLSNKIDVIIIGGGPAGLSAGLWCSDLGLRPLILEKESEFGGQLVWTFNAIENYLGIKTISGRDLRDRFVQHIANKAVTCLADTSVVDFNAVEKWVQLADGNRLSGRAIIIATGVRRRKLEILDKNEFAGHGIIESGAKDRDMVRDKTVVIVGGGDAALENSIILSETAKRVVIVHRGGEFSARSEFVDAARQKVNVVFNFGVIVSSIIGGTTISGVQLKNIQSGEESTIPADALLVRIGVIPNTELFRGEIALDDRGYINVGSAYSTNIEMVYAIGDVASPESPTVSSAVGQGASVAKALINNL